MAHELDEAELDAQIKLLAEYFNIKQYVCKDREFAGYRYVLEAIKQRYYGMQQRDITKHLVSTFGGTTPKILSAMKQVIFKGSLTRRNRFDRLRYGSSGSVPETIDAFANWLHTYRGVKLEEEVGGVPTIIWKPYDECANGPLWRMVRFLRIALQETDPYVDSIEIDFRNDEVINIWYANGDKDMVPSKRPLYDVMLDIIMACQEHNILPGNPGTSVH